MPQEDIGPESFGIVDTLGLLVAIVVVAASVSDNVGGIATVEKARTKSGRLTKIFCDGGFKRSFVAYCGGAHISAEVVSRYTKVGSKSSPDAGWSSAPGRG